MPSMQLTSVFDAKATTFYCVYMYPISSLSLFYRFIVPMKNGDLDSKGFLASIIESEGTIESFKVCF